MKEQLTEEKTPVQITDDLTDCKIIVREMTKALQDSDKKSRYRSLAITALEEAENWILKAQATE